MSEFAEGFADQLSEVSVDDLPVSGDIPAWLNGVLLRNGPARWRIGDRRLNHWFDGLAMLHRFAIADQRVSYRNRFLRTPDFEAAADGKLAFAQFATDPCRSLFKRMTANFSPTFSHNANVNIGKFEDDFVAMTELPIQVTFDPQTLETLGVADFADQLEGFVTTAHPHFDAQAKETINYLVKFGPKSTYNVYALPVGSAKRRLIASIPVSRPSYMHSFAMTANYVILMEFPLSVLPIGLLVSGRPFIDNYSWHPEHGTTFTVVDKRDGSVRKLNLREPWFSFHHVNAFEVDGVINIDVDVYPDAEIVTDLFLNSLLGPAASSDYSPPALPQSTVRRFSLHLAEDRVESNELVAQTVELPRINYGANSTRPYQYVYGVSVDPDSPSQFLDRIVKADVDSGDVITWSASNSYPGEPVFVSRPDGEAEDDGVILSVVLDSATGTSYLLILDARDLSEVARAHVPQAVPFGFHGQFVATR